MQKFVTLGEYYDKEALVEIEAKLRSLDIMFMVETAETHLNSAMGQANAEPIVLKVKEEDFDQASAAIGLESDEEVSIDDYSDEELKEIVLNPHEWHASFVEKASAVLNSRNIQVEGKEKYEHEKTMLEDLQKGKEPDKFIFAMMWIFAFVGGIIGIIAGYSYWQGKEKGFDGTKYYMYTEKYRTRGYLMFWMGIFSLSVGVILFLWLNLL